MLCNHFLSVPLAANSGMTCVFGGGLGGYMYGGGEKENLRRSRGLHTHKEDLMRTLYLGPYPCNRAIAAPTRLV